MSDTQINQELRDFMQKNNLDPFNHYAYAKLLMKQQEQIDEIAEHTRLPDFQRDGEWFMGGRLIDKWNNK